VSVGTSLAIAALNRAIAPLSKSAIFEWLATTTLRRHFPSASKTTLVSQRFWDHMERLDCDMTRMIWKDILGDVIAREALTVDAVCYDGTNFYTFIGQVSYSREQFFKFMFLPSKVEVTYQPKKRRNCPP
jgi:hypothetical protein